MTRNEWVAQENRIKVKSSRYAQGPSNGRIALRLFSFHFDALNTNSLIAIQNIIALFWRVILKFFFTQHLCGNHIEKKPRQINKTATQR